MAILLFKLNNVPDDEAFEIRELLQANEIYFYETQAGFWRVGLDAIWLPDNTREEQARELIKTYQAARTRNQKRNYAELVEQGTAPSFWQNLCERPIRFIAALAAILFVLLLTFTPFLMMFQSH